MKKIVLSLVLISFVTLPSIGLAAPRRAPVVPIMQMFENIADWLFSILLIIAVIFLIVAAFYFVTAQGDPERLSKARNMVLYALIGVLIAFAARGLVLLVETIVGGGRGI